MGYSRAGFEEIVGVDNRPQKNYPFRFVQADALEYLAQHGKEYDAIHTSPPCQGFTSMRKMWNAREHPDLLTPTRLLLVALKIPFVIENVPGAPMLNYVTLCGSMFGLGSGDAELRRHRWFEINPPQMWLRRPCAHNQRPRTNTVLSHGGNDGSRNGPTVGVYGHSGGSSNREKARVIGVYGGHGRDHRRRTNTQGFSVKERSEAMGIDWMTGDELSQGIPPAYTEYIGKELLKQL